VCNYARGEGGSLHCRYIHFPFILNNQGLGVSIVLEGGGGVGVPTL
jgi:hypothetical protein